MTVYTSITGNNADLIATVADLYTRSGSLIVDVTWGRGAFWRRTSHVPIGSDVSPDLAPHVACDFRKLPYRDNSVDVVVLDPPYVHNPGNHITNGRYNNAATTSGMYHEDIMRLYEDGMREAWRVLRPNGQTWVKCKDQVESGRQCWSHIELHDIAIKLGFFARDLFVITPDSRTTPNRWARQIHARKNHSYLWVFEHAG